MRILGSRMYDEIRITNDHILIKEKKNATKNKKQKSEFQNLLEMAFLLKMFAASKTFKIRFVYFLNPVFKTKFFFKHKINFKLQI